MNKKTCLISMASIALIGCGETSSAAETTRDSITAPAIDPGGLAGAAAPLPADATPPIDLEATGTTPGPTESTDPADPSRPSGLDAPADADPPFAAPAPVGCVSDVSAGKHDFACNGIRHLVSVPDACLAHACGLVVDVHGGTMDAAMEDHNTDMAALGTKAGYLVVQPSAFGNNWNPGVDDDKIAGFMQDMFAAFHVDRDRVHMMGFSQGGFMTWRFVCKHADWFASVSPGGAGTTVPLSPAGCAFSGAEMPGAEVSILHLAGTKDAFVPIASQQQQRDTVVAAWSMPAPNLEEGPGFRRSRYASPAGTVYEYLEHDYETDAAFFVAIKGHCYPGSTDYAPQVPGQLMGFGCKGDNAFHWGQEAIRFFVEHPKPAAVMP